MNLRQNDNSTNNNAYTSYFYDIKVIYQVK